MVLTCPYCGNPNPDYAVFCGRCGRQLTQLQQQSSPITTPYPQQYSQNQLQPNTGEEMALYFIQVAGEGPYFEPVSVLLTDRRILYSKTHLLKNLAIQFAGQAVAGVIGRSIAKSIIRDRNIKKVREILSTIPPNEIIKELRVPLSLAPQLEKPNQLPYEKIKEVIIVPSKSQKAVGITFKGSYLTHLTLGIPLVDPQYAINMLYNTPLRDRVKVK